MLGSAHQQLGSYFRSALQWGRGCQIKLSHEERMVFLAVGSLLEKHRRNSCMETKTFHLCITPEGTRSLNPNWKKGFYFIALKAKIPILLYGLDYQKRVIECKESFLPTGDTDKDMRHIKLYFKDYKGKFPQKFTIGDLAQ